MTKKELRKISLQYRTLSSQMLKIDSQEEVNYIQMFYDYITNTPVIFDYIQKCSTTKYDFKEIFARKEWNDILILPSSQEELIGYGYQLLQYVLDGPKQLFILGQGYTGSNKFKDAIAAFMRKSIEPFVVALRNFLELELIDCDESQIEKVSENKTIFLSYCQKDSDIADLIDEQLGEQIKGKATISRDIRDVEYHESFKRFMQSIEQHDYVITVISDSYFKSRNCMYEVLEVVKDSRFSDKLVFIVLRDEDCQYYKTPQANGIAANVYSTEGQTSYSIFWKHHEIELQKQIDDLGDPTYAITQIKEKKVIQKILLDLPEFIEFVRDSKGLSLTEHVAHNFSDIIKFMNL